MSTETVDPRYEDLDLWPTETVVQAMLEGQIAAMTALQGQTRAIAEAAEAAAGRLRRGGRLVYVGAGTSGRVAVQDGVELGPTYGWPDARTVYLMAGGLKALTQAVEGAEDDGDAGRAEIEAAEVGPDDVVVGLAASGRTPYTIAAIEAARAAGAPTPAIANNEGAPLLAAAGHRVLAETGSEIVAGSTRMKAGTAQKVVLNLFSTAVMIRLGGVYRGRMVGMRISNAKLQARAEVMVAELAGVDAEAARAALAVSARDIRVAVLVAKGRGADEARAALTAAGGDLRKLLSDA